MFLGGWISGGLDDPGQGGLFPSASAMIDRLVHHAEVLSLSGDTYRTRARRELLAAGAEPGVEHPGTDRS